MGLSCCVFCAALTQEEGKQDKLKTESGKFWGAAVADGTRVSRRLVSAALRRGRYPHRRAQSHTAPFTLLSLRTSPQAGVAIRNPLPARFRVWQRVGFAAFLLPFRKKRVRSHYASDSLFFMDMDFIEITADSSAGQRRCRRYTRRSGSGCRS